MIGGAERRTGCMMRQPRRLGILAAAVVALTLVACDEDNGARVVAPDGTEIEITATPTDVPAEGSPSAVVTEGAGSGEDETPTTSPDATATADATETASEDATSTPSSGGAGAGSAGDLEGSPFSTADVRTAMPSTFDILDDSAPICPNTAVPEVTFVAWSEGTDYGPAFVLWVYPDADAAAEDWALGEDVDPLTDGCDLPTGFTYFNANLVMTFRSWVSQGEEIGPYDPDRSPRDAPPVEAFLGMDDDAEDEDED